ncbi:peptidase inhibitor family I36 protein [Streptomyces andamanensis]|uniref:Peptidase inhibitor family I36 protein n=1 Tax=Streptomyces andamanensis TaxID=1565035 RepID=A0ABV8TJN3_9ACTN
MRRLRHLCLVLGALAALLGATTGPAQAAPAAYQCDAAHDHDGVLVIFADRDYGGECRASSYPQVGDLRNVGFNDTISSLKNRTPNTLCFYSDSENKGKVFQIHAWEWWWTLPDWIDDQISSYDFC